MEEKPRVVITSRARRPEPAAKDFKFTADMLPRVHRIASLIAPSALATNGREGALADYRRRAWETYARLAMPTVAEEAWRRTDLRELPADTFHLPATGAFRDLVPVPEELLRPLTADPNNPGASRHGGQVILLPGGSRISLAPELASKKVIFTDLRAAEAEHPELVARMAGELVRPEEGKFAALAGAFSQNGVVLYVPKGVTVEQPLNSLLWGPGSGLAHVSHLLVWVDEALR